MPSRRRRILVAAAVASVGVALYLLAFRSDPGDPRLNAFVHSRPPVPVVFTSRATASSFQARAPEGEDFRYPGTALWAAPEGRLRVLRPDGTVRELTWGKPLPDGGTLIDVMSPSLSLDGERVLFAGRKGGEGHGHFRIYEVGLDGSGLRPLTGGPDDPGATAAPPMRFRLDGSLIPEAERRQTDYDDVDPIEARAEPREILFVSSRAPDLGRDHARRSTTLWLLNADGRKSPASANRNNDRWPFLLSSGYVAFSLWSRNREVVSEDGTAVQPLVPGTASATRPTDNWFGAFTLLGSSGHFGMLVKPGVPVWRPRPLFNGRVTFMTTPDDPAKIDPPLTVVQAPPGLISIAPSSAGDTLPKQKDVRLRHGPARDSSGRVLWSATPSPCPPDDVLLAGAPLEAGESRPAPGRYGVYLASANWPDADRPADAAAVGLRLLFDDPDLVDAEPVAAYHRKVKLPTTGPAETPAPDAELKLVGDRSYRGPAGRVFATGLYAAMMNDLPGQQTDVGEGPVFTPPPAGSVRTVRVYAARRDRFDDPVKPRVPGEWELLLELPATETAGGLIPTDAPTVLAGFGADGKVVHWSSNAKDSTGKRASFYAIAGDHYSLTAPGGKHFCVGCHPGHSGIPKSQHNHAEQRGE